MLFNSSEKALSQLDSCLIYVPSTLSLSCDFNVPSYTLIPFSTCDFTFFNLKIYNRWAEIVFQSETIDIIWDANKMPGDTYIYFLKAETLNGQCFDSSGHITILK